MGKTKTKRDEQDEKRKEKYEKNLKIYNEHQKNLENGMKKKESYERLASHFTMNPLTIKSRLSRFTPEIEDIIPNSGHCYLNSNEEDFLLGLCLGLQGQGTPLHTETLCEYASKLYGQDLQKRKGRDKEFTRDWATGFLRRHSAYLELSHAEPISLARTPLSYFKDVEKFIQFYSNERKYFNDKPEFIVNVDETRVKVKNIHGRRKFIFERNRKHKEYT